MNQPGLQSDDAARRFGVRGLLAFTAVFLIAVPFGTLVLLLRQKVAWLRRIDLTAAANLHDFDERHPGFVTTMKVITNSGSSLVWLIVLTLAGLWLLYRKLYRLTAFLAVTAIGGSLLNGAIKQAVGRTRPVLVNPIATATGKSFPSGHTQSAMVNYGILLLVFLPVVSRRWRPLIIVVASIMVGLIGFSRVALGVHYVSDVVGGIIIGAAWLLAMTAAFSAWRRDRQLPPVTPADGLEPENSERLKPDSP
ncbi:phosphatase PAP2 family protein [Jatrophihabitans sp. DSM 45814]